MPKINLIITGPIRPNKNVDYLNYLVNKFKTIIDYDVNIFLCYWEDNTIDAKKINNKPYFWLIDEKGNQQKFQMKKKKTD